MGVAAQVKRVVHFVKKAAGHLAPSAAFSRSPHTPSMAATTRPCSQGNLACRFFRPRRLGQRNAQPVCLPEPAEPDSGILAEEYRDRDGGFGVVG